MVPLDSHEVSRASQYSGTGCVLFGFEYGAITRCGGAFQLASSAYSRIAYAGLQPRMVETTRFGLFPFRSPLLWESRLISLPPGTEMFHFPGLASLGLYIQLRMMT